MFDSMKVPRAAKTRNHFDLGYDGVFSHELGDIVPVVCKEMVPGDTFNCNVNLFSRLSPLASPTYGRIHCYVNYFFVPNRILLGNDLWENFYRGGVDGKTSYHLPSFYTDDVARFLLDSVGDFETWQIRNVRKLFTYLGLPDPYPWNSTISPESDMARFNLSLLPFAAYNRIYGDYYFPWNLENDQNAESIYFMKWLEGEEPFSYWGNSPETMDFFSVKRACFKKDYQTTSQTKPERGGQAFAPTAGQQDISHDGGVLVDPDNQTVLAQPESGISAIAIRWANSLQKFLERKNIAGARYFEQVLASLGVKINAERLQRSEYLGGNDFEINIWDVTSTADTSTASLGTMAGKGIGQGGSNVSYTANDFGFFFACVHYMPECGTPQALSRMWSRADRLDYFNPEFEEVGMQPLYNSEVYADKWLRGLPAGTMDMKKTGVFGYIPRFADYKFSNPLLGGDFRIVPSSGLYPSQLVNDLNSMHLYRLFGDWTQSQQIPTYQPTLNIDFVRLTHDKDKEFTRVFQDTNTDFDHYWTHLIVSLDAERPMLGYAEGASDFTSEDDGANINLPYGGTRL